VHARPRGRVAARLGAALFALLLLALPARARTAELSTVSADGVGAIIGGQIPGARDRAIDDALRKAVEQAAGVVVSSESVQENFQLVEDKILTRAKGYVKKYEIVKEGREEETYRVSIKAEVSLEILAKDLCNLLARRGMPRVAVVIAEQNVGDAMEPEQLLAELSVAETTVMGYLKNRCFLVVDTAQASASRDREAALAAVRGDNQAAAALAKHLGADILITGKAQATDAGGILGTLRSVQVSITARAVRAANGHVLVAGTEQAAVPHVSALQGGVVGLQKAATALAAKFASGIVEEIAPTQETLTVVLTGVASFGELSHFREVLTTGIQGVKDVYDREYAGTSATLDVVCACTARGFAEQINQTVFGRYKAHVTGTTGSTVTITLSH
jgi:serine/threonine-protein kinase